MTEGNFVVCVKLQVYIRFAVLSELRSAPGVTFGAKTASCQHWTRREKGSKLARKKKKHYGSTVHTAGTKMAQGGVPTRTDDR